MKGCLQILYFNLSHPGVVGLEQFLALTEHGYRDWKPFDMLTAKAEGPLKFSSKLVSIFPITAVSYNWNRKKNPT